MNVRVTFMRWLPLAFLITAFCLLVYIVAQQDMRQSANDPQVQMVEDAVTASVEGMSPKEIALSFGGALFDNSDNLNTVDVAESLKPFIIVFDRSGNVLAASAHLDGIVPLPPIGVFSYTDKNDEDRFTWQPVPQVRIAAIMHKVSHRNPDVTSEKTSTSTVTAGDNKDDKEAGFILAGRSLREVEIREKAVFNQVALVWIVLLMLSLGYNIFISGKSK